MSDKQMSRQTAPTRRQTLKYGSTLAAGVALAGCSEQTGNSQETSTTGDGS